MNYDQAKRIATAFGVHVSCSKDMFIYHVSGYIASLSTFGPTAEDRKNIGYYGLPSARLADFFVLGRINPATTALKVYLNEEPTPEEKAAFWVVMPKDLPRRDCFFEWLKERGLNKNRLDSVAVELKQLWDENGGGYSAN